MIKARKILFDQDEKPERELTAYRYDRTSGIFCGRRQVAGQRMPNGDWVYLLKVHETMEEPPIVEDGQVAVFLERTRSWVTVKDHRGEIWFDWKGRPQLIGRAGDPAEWGLRKSPQGEAP